MNDEPIMIWEVVVKAKQRTRRKRYFARPDGDDKLHILFVNAYLVIHDPDEDAFRLVYERHVKES